ncbi:hypothetical protein AQF52_3056 [Streptomyces venezuelae]|uniref:hypothetical protein n=1 Tax=Streptomyces gardneri TaxID=66892 RepID=UPI00071EF5CC|nr:hypothetical protein [Streptomyces gardneri]ALO08650.1 hypothetical protein AQF52_3056 [Streptomyces venezuelae]QPK45846.1 hypothetical protein H4W23_15175 [Streptomyces gardneri]WRK37195.1 hypothetical protein U0M97_15250 [Streptomyces venezuelae]
MAPAPLRQRSALVVTATAAVTAAVTATVALALTAPALAAPAAAHAPKTSDPGTAAPAAFASAPPAPGDPRAPQAPEAPKIPAPDPPTPSCGDAPDGGFPLATRIHGGPDEYPAGGPLQAWKLDLTNDTEASCTGVHPVLVLADRDRVLRPAQIRFEFYDEGSARWRPVAFETTEEAENVGAFTDFGGFSVPAGRTVTVPVRLAFREDTAPDEVVVSAAVVQRRGADGDWIGASDEYRLTVGPAAPDGSGTPEPRSDAADPPAQPPKKPEAPKPPKSTEGIDPSRELARTGRESDQDALLLGSFAAVLVLLGATLVRTARRMAPRPARGTPGGGPRRPRHL